MTFRTKFNLPETATESLIKFMKLVLEEIGGSNFDSFPSSFYLARNIFNLHDRFHNFVQCPKCHKLYNKREVTEFQESENLSVMKCSHVEFPNSVVRRSKLCQIALSEQTRLLNGRIIIQ